MSIVNKLLAVFYLFLISVSSALASDNTASATFSFVLPEFVRIRPVTSPVLIANITDRTGNLHSPISTVFRVVTNTAEEKTLYLKANVITQDGYEEAMFERGGQVYVAFANISKQPTSSSLMSCKLGGNPSDSPGIVAYPVLSILGVKSKFNPAKNKYEVYVNNGSTDITVNVGANVLRSSFAKNDPRGFYQTVLSLTESDI